GRHGRALGLDGAQHGLPRGGVAPTGRGGTGPARRPARHLLRGQHRNMSPTTHRPHRRRRPWRTSRSTAPGRRRSSSARPSRAAPAASTTRASPSWTCRRSRTRCATPRSSARSSRSPPATRWSSPPRTIRSRCSGSSRPSTGTPSGPSTATAARSAGGSWCAAPPERVEERRAPCFVPQCGQLPGAEPRLGTLARVKILVIGSGGREHAIIRRLAADRPAPELHAAPGNPGIAQLAATHDVAVGDLDGQVRLAGELQPDLVVIGPEAPLVAGAADRLREAGQTVFGPSAAAAHLEGSKPWAKEVMAAAGVPTAASVTVTALEQLGAGLDRVNPLGDVPFVVKADGLAAGKGVVVTEDRDAAITHAEAVLAAGGRVVLEEFL